MNLSWRRENTPEELHPLLETLGEEYPIRENGTGKLLDFTKTDGNSLRVRTLADRVSIEYGQIHCAARGIGMALAELETDETMEFRTLGVMVDCSRGAVFTIPHWKGWLRKLALAGYNMAWVYAEDVYQLPDEPYFGYLRGAYSLEEMQDLDRYAQKLGIEMVACIQTLGHLEQLLKWRRYDKVADTPRILLADDEGTYRLIEKMADFWSQAFHSRRIHIGMDEAHELARGTFQDKHGYEDVFQVFNRHLGKVREIFQSRGLTTMIWSDMYFRLGSARHNYYDLKSEIPEEVRKQIPKGVQLVYWDYYHDNEDFYEEWIRRHRELGSEPVMAAAVAYGVHLWYNHEITRTAGLPCIQACRNAKVNEIIFTMWTGDGAAIHGDSVLAGLIWSADRVYGAPEDDSRMESMFQAVCGDSFRAYVAASDLDFTGTSPLTSEPYSIWAPLILWDDPLLGIYWREMIHFDPECWPKILQRMTAVREQLQPWHDDPADSLYLKHAWNCADVLAKKIIFRTELLEAYRKKDRQALQDLKDKGVPEVIAALQAWHKSFGACRRRCCRNYGEELIQNRIGGMILRYQVTAGHLEEYLNGDEEALTELATEITPYGIIPIRYAAVSSSGTPYMKL